MDKLNATWLGEFKSVIFLALGVLAVFKIPYMMPFIAFLFIVLFGMIALLRIGEVYFLNRTQNKTEDLIAAFINIGFIIWTVIELVRYPYEDYHIFASNIFMIIGAWLVVIIVWGIVQGFIYIINKNVLGNLVLIETVLSTLLMLFFYRVTNAISNDNIDDRILMNFGVFCISLALISYLHARVVKYLAKISEEKE